MSKGKICVIGSGPIVIGQAAEFDYAGTQACLSLKEEGYEVVLINSNPATIMTDTDIADKVYIEPLTLESITQILRIEKVDALLPSLGGQTGLNMALELSEAGVLDSLNIKLLGTDLTAIKKAEDRELFKNLMLELGEPIPQSAIVHTVEEAVASVKAIGYPVIVRPAFTMGGSGGGRCENEEALIDIVAKGLMLSPVSQCLVEQDISGYKEVEYEVIRDSKGNAMVICTMENFDPVGVHTGDSIVFAPAQTLSDKEIQILRDSALRIIGALGIEGGCNVQYAFDPHSFNYYVIEVNPRVSRSSALASKATGYPIAKITAKIAVGKTLDALDNPINPQTKAFFEPVLDYVVAKIPRWPFDKFERADRSLGTQMKATGEVMSMGSTLEEALLKAVRSLELGIDHLELKKFKDYDDTSLSKLLMKPTDERLFVIAECFRRGYEIEDIFALTKIDRFFLSKIQHIIALEKDLLNPNIKKYGFSNSYLKRHGVSNSAKPVFKMVDSCSAMYDVRTPYFYSTFGSENESVVSDRKRIVVLGSGPIRIGQGVEFDYATVHCVKAIQDMGYEAIIINNNPETVSTDFELADKLYFEPLTFDDVMNVIDLEKPEGVIVQFGGQTAINLAQDLQDAGVKIIGTSLEDINKAEDRKLFTKFLDDLDILQPLGDSAQDEEALIEIAQRIGYPVLIRPSFVLGGQSMKIVYDEENLRLHIHELSFKHPVLIDRYVLGTELEIDAICDGESVLMPGIMEHIEKSGVHSGDSFAVYPPRNINAQIIDQVVDITTKIALGLKTRGLVNIQFIVEDDKVFVIEVNPRASRTVPFLSKVTGIPMAKWATQAALGKPLERSGLVDFVPGYHVKAPVFSFAKLRRVDTVLSPEMKSTGEVMGSDMDYSKALYKAFIGSGYSFKQVGSVLLTVADHDKPKILPLVAKLDALGFKFLATKNTAKFLNEQGYQVDYVDKLKGQNQGNILDVIRDSNLNFIINTVSSQSLEVSDGMLIRRVASEQGVPLFTSLDTASALIEVLASFMMRPWLMKGE